MNKLGCGWKEAPEGFPLLFLKDEASSSKPVLLNSGTQAVRAKRHRWPMALTVTDKGQLLPAGPVPKT